MVARFTAINKTGGYHTDIGGRVFAARPSPFQQTELPALNLWDMESSTQQFASGVQQHTLKVSTYILANGNDVAAYIRLVESDLAKAIGVDRRWTVSGVQLAIDTRPKGNLYEIDNETKRVTGAVKYDVEIIYRTPSFDMDSIA